MNSYRRNRRDAGSLRPLVVATIFVVLIFCVDLVSHGAIRSIVRDVGSAIWERGDAVVSRIGDSGIFATRASLAQENAALRAEVAQLQDAAAANNATDAENEQLRAFTHLATTIPGITAPITSSFRASPYGTFTIGAGSADNVQSGALVSTSDGFIIGRVADVGAHSSLVSELFAPGQSIDVLAGSIPLSLQGSGGGVASGDAAHGVVIAVGTSVVAPSLGQRPVGVVGEVQSDPASPSTNVLVRLPVNLESLSFVYVETVH